MRIILISFQVLSIQVFASEKLKISVRDLMACCPICFRYKYDIPSGPVEEELFVACMAWVTIGKVIRGCRGLGACILCRWPGIILSWGCVGSLLIWE